MILGIAFLLLVGFGIFVYTEQNNPIEHQTPTAFTKKQKIEVYYGYSVDPNLGPSHRERRQGETIKRTLDMEKPVVLSSNESVITVEIPYKRQIKELKIIKEPVLKDTNIIPKEETVSVSKGKSITFHIPKEDIGTFKYIIRTEFESGYVDYGFLIKKDS